MNQNNIKIRFTQDCSECKCCGYNRDDYGIELWRNGEKLIDLVAIASCFGNGSTCYSGINQIDLVANSLFMSPSLFYKQENEWSDEEKESNEYYDYYEYVRIMQFRLSGTH